MKILQIVKGLDIGGQFGGAERFGVELGLQLQKLGHDVTICSFFRTGGNQEAEWEKRILNAGLGLMTLQPWRGGNRFGDFLQSIITLVKTCRESPPTVVHSHFQLGTFAAIALKKCLNVEVCIRTAHLASEWEKGWLGKAKSSAAHYFYPRYLDIQIGVSREIVDALCKNYKHGTKMLPARLIYNGINMGTESPLRPESQKKSSSFTIGSVGRLTEQKGFSDLISATAIAQKQIPNLRLILVGEGELRESLQDGAEKLGIEDYVTFTGKVSNVKDYLNQFDLFISSSLWEGLPTVIMEAMLAGVPVVATSIPGSIDLVTPGVNGWLASPNKPDHLAEVIVDALLNPEHRESYRRAAAVSVKEFSLERIAEKYQALYIEIMS